MKDSSVLALSAISSSHKILGEAIILARLLSCQPSEDTPEIAVASDRQDGHHQENRQHLEDLQHQELP